VAGAGALLVLPCAAAVLAASAAGLTAAPRHAHGLSGWLGRRRWPSIGRLAAALAGLSRHRAGPGWAAAVVACTAACLLADAGVLAACFGLAGLPVPWRGLLLAYAAGQLAGRLVPLPGGLGGVEGGLLARSCSPVPRPVRRRLRSSSTEWPGTGLSVLPVPRWRQPSPAAPAGQGVKRPNTQRACHDHGQESALAVAA